MQGEGGRGNRGERRAGQALLGGSVGHDAHESTQQNPAFPQLPPPPFTVPNSASHVQRCIIDLRVVLRVNKESEGKMKTRRWMKNIKKILLVDENIFDQSIYS